MEALYRRLRYRLGGEVVQHLGFHSAWALPASSSLLAEARRIPADLTIVHNEAPHWVGWQLIQEGRRVAADLEDWHSEDLLPEHSLKRPLRLLRAQEKALLHQAIYTTTTSQSLATALHQRYGGSAPEVVTNSFPLQPNPLPRPLGEPPSFYWFSQTVGPGRGLEPWIQAWARTITPSHLVLQGECAPQYQKKLLSLLPPAKQSQLQFLPLTDPDQLPAFIARHDIGLALEESSIGNRNLTITNKILQYLNAGLPVLASHTEGQREVLARDSEAGWLVDLNDTQGLTRKLDAILQDKPRLDKMRWAARSLAENVYCWEKEAPTMVERVHQSLLRNFP
ncbi:MAG: glycosyltransferase family 4 protein [Blastochloris sp.]|nr:glycosyltransferase family 4 protein [Blastochloris sp.]